MSGGASSSSSISSPVGLDVSDATIIDINELPVLETLTCFDEARVGTPNTVNVKRVLLPLGEALSSPFAPDFHVMGGKLQLLTDFAVGADAKVADRFRFQNAETQLASS